VRNQLIKPCAIALAVTSALCQQAYANEAEEVKIDRQQTTNSVNVKPEAKEDVEQIIVTGSRLKRDSFSVTTPLVTMDKAAIEDTGLSNLSDILVDNMPGLGIDIGNTTSQSNNSNTGLSTVELRNLGANRTLTLIDGRRVVANSYSGNYVSLNTIPSGMVERVEIISGGASATYGADAVAGVVNIITQSKKEGFDFSAKTGRTDEGGGKTFTIDANYGSSFAEDRGYMYVSANWDRDFGISYYDRKRAQMEADVFYNEDELCNGVGTTTGDQCMRDTTRADWRDRSDGLPGGVFLESSKNDTQFWYDGTNLRDDWAGNEELYGINSAQYVMLNVPSDNLSLALKADFDINDSTTAYAQVQFSKSGSFNNKSPEDTSEGSEVVYINPTTGEAEPFSAGYIPIDNPYVPQRIIDSDPYKDRIYWDRRFNEVGNISTDNNRETIRTWAGLQGTMFDEMWDWDVSVGYGRYKQKQVRANELSLVRLAQALDAEKLNDGTIQCADSDARDEGCVAVNLFGEGSITPEMADWIRSTPVLETTNEQLTLMGYISGDLFELPAGYVSSVFGGEYRRDSQDIKTSTDMQTGGITYNYMPEFYGEIDVVEAFAEFGIPLLRDAPLAKSLDAETSIRISNYDIDEVGTVASYKLGLFWKPVDTLALRANYARAQRAPTITEFMSPERGDYDSYKDICDGVTATSDDIGHNNCRLDPAIAALITEDASFELDDDNSGYSPSSGNSNIKEETADTYTAGFTYSPESLKDFNLAVDYYDIAIEDAIDEISNENILYQCYASNTGYGTTNPFCNDITRGSDGQINKIQQREYNLDEIRTRGYDVVATYNFDLDDMGNIAVKLDYNHIIEHSQTFLGEDGDFVTTNYVGYGRGKDKAAFSLSWSNENLRIRWSSQFQGSFREDEQLDRDYEKAIAKNTEKCANESADCISNPEPLAFQKFGSFIKHNLAASYTMELDNNSELRLSGGINNIFDNNGAFFPHGTGNFNSDWGGGKGRYMFIGAQYSF
tara:strand:+ start:182 stop:3214 length:3033 start_codon:yes stop_codon:yes gene_type:complete